MLASALMVVSVAKSAAATSSAIQAPTTDALYQPVSFGGIPSYDTSNVAYNYPVVGMASSPNGAGYWLVASDGGIFAFGDAGFYGSASSLRLDQPLVGMAATPDGKGYWLVAGDGGVFAYGGAEFYGSMGEQHLDEPIVGIAARLVTDTGWSVRTVESFLSAMPNTMDPRAVSISTSRS